MVKKSFMLGAIIITVSFTYSMKPSVRKALDDAHSTLQLRLSHLDKEANEARWEYNYVVARIVSEAGDLMSKQEKLNHLCGDERFKIRKSVIEDMMMIDGIDPNTIEYQATNPLHESLNHHDISFATYLLERGARPDMYTIKNAQKNPEFKSLFSKYEEKDKSSQSQDHDTLVIHNKSKLATIVYYSPPASLMAHATIPPFSKVKLTIPVPSDQKPQTIIVRGNELLQEQQLSITESRKKIIIDPDKETIRIN